MTSEPVGRSAAVTLTAGDARTRLNRSGGARDRSAGRGRRPDLTARRPRAGHEPQSGDPRILVSINTANHLKTGLVVAALDIAVAQRQPTEVILHSDHGTQYTSLAFGQRCRQAGVRPSMGSVGDAYDNAMCESFFASLECELLDRYTFKSQTEARMAIFRYIEGWYHPHRRHSALDYQSPVNYEGSALLRLSPPAAQTLRKGRTEARPARPSRRRSRDTGRAARPPRGR
jgi:transposase InsO family protein